MFIVAAISYLGGWQFLQTAHRAQYDQLTDALARVSLPSSQSLGKRTATYSIDDQLRKALSSSGWQCDVAIGLSTGKATRFTLDFLAGDFALKLIIGKQAFVLSALYASFPLAAQLRDIKLSAILLPMRSLCPHLPRGATAFEFTKSLLTELPHTSMRKPFVILGLAQEVSQPAVTELTSELDRYLIECVGYTLQEMASLSEHPSYDFKRELPANETIAKEVCAMANHLSGGLLIFGVEDSGRPAGLPQAEVDAAQLRITNVIRDACKPIPPFQFNIFPVPYDEHRLLIVLRVEQISPMPCLYSGRAYIRSGPSARQADAGEIRSLVLMSSGDSESSRV